MAVSTIKLYMIPGLQDENNYIIENAIDYINGKFQNPILRIDNFQYQRLESLKTIKINYDQTLTESMLFNYCVIRNSDSLFYQFYFVQRYEQRAQNTVMISLKLDVLNTFWDYFKDRFSAGTFISRAHKDRFKVIEVDKTNRLVTLANIFDRVSEGDNPELYGYNETEKTITDETGGDDGNLHFCLIYRTAGDGRPCIDMASAEGEILIRKGSQGSGDYVLNLSDLVDGRYYYLIGEFSVNIQWVDQVGGVTRRTGQHQFTTSNGVLRFSKSTVSNLAIEIQFSDDSQSFYTSGVYQFYDEFLGNVTRGSVGPVTVTKGRRIYFSNVKTYEKEMIENFSSYSIDAGYYDDVYLGSISLLDRTESENVKVIETPYSPVEYSFNNTTGVYTFPGTFFETKSPEGFLRTYDLEKKFPLRVIDNWYASTETLQVVNLDSLESVSYDLTYDPKLRTSAYYRHTYFYDSFAYSLKMEDFTLEGNNLNGNLYIHVNYKQSSSISSALMFSFTSYELISGVYKKKFSDQNYDNVLLASRNNELPLYSSEYLNYLRNGYNYDKKKIEQGTIQASNLAAMQLVASVISFALSGVTGGVSAAAGVGLAAGAATSFANIAYSQKQGNESLDQKINTLKKQSFSVSGVDDLDLFKEYGKNKLKYKLYKISEKESRRIELKFKYYGYAVEDYLNPYPNYTNSRKFFNFLQVDPVFYERAFDLQDEFLGEITDKLKAGVTIWHKAGYEQNNYALDRDVENVENTIIEAIENA